MIKQNVRMEINKDPVIKLEDKNDIEYNEDYDDNICSVSDSIPTLKTKLKKMIDKNICYKCKVNKSNYFNRNENICRECFIWMMNHKFRSNLRAHCKIRYEDYVLVCISGGNSSMSMLHLFNISLNSNQFNRKLFFRLKVLYIDDSILLPNKNFLTERNKKKDLIQNICYNYGFEFEIINLEMSMALPDFNMNPIEKISLYDIDNEKIDKYIKLYLHLHESISNSFKAEFVKITIRNLIFYYSRINNFTKVIYANNAQGIVNNIFNTIIKGRGFTVREDTGYIDDHFLFGKIIILRPMKDFLTKEILLYSYINKIEIIYSAYDLDISTKYKHSSNFLLKSFFDKLQDRMGSTVSTVLATADKLCLKYSPEQKLCAFCLNYIDEVYNDLEIGSIDAISNE